MISVALALTVLSGCNLHVLRGNGQLATENRPAPAAFHEISFSSGIGGDVKIGPPSISVTADSNLLPYIETRIKDGELEVRLQEGISHYSDHDIVVHVTTPAFDRVGSSGGAQVKVFAGKTQKLVLQSSGGGSMDALGVASDELELDSSGGGEMTLKGAAKRVTAEVSGGGKLHAAEMATGTMNLQGSGGATIEAQVDAELSGELSGGSRLALKGKRPALKGFEVSGGSEISSE